MLLQVESALLNAKSHNPTDSLPQIESIQQIVMAINALSKVKIRNRLCEVVNCSRSSFPFFFYDCNHKRMLLYLFSIQLLITIFTRRNTCLAYPI